MYANYSPEFEDIKKFMGEAENLIKSVKNKTKLETIPRLLKLGLTYEQISHALDANDPMPNKYTLEVSSPGLERKLRTRDHFEGAKGEIVGVKLAPHVEGERRFKGRLSSVSSDSILVETESGEKVEILIDDISKATTVFQWKQNQKPGQSTSNGKKI